MSERAPRQRRQGWLYPTLGAMALVLCGIGVGWLAFGGARSASVSGRTTSTEVEAAEQHAAAQTLNVVNRTAIDPELLREQVTIAVGKAFDARSAVSPTIATSAEPASEQPITAKNIEAFDSAQAVLAKGIASRRWTRASRSEFDAALSGTTREQLSQATSDLIRRFNSGEIQYDPWSE